MNVEACEQVETLSAATLWMLARAGDIADMIVNHWLHPDHAPTINSIGDGPLQRAPFYNTLDQDQPRGYVRVPLPRSDYFLRRDDGSVIGLPKFQALAEVSGVNHEQEAFSSLFAHSLSGPLRHFDEEFYESSHAVLAGRDMPVPRESQGGTLPERIFFDVIKTKKYRIPTMAEAMYVTLVLGRTNRAAAEKYGLREETVKKNRAELIAESGYEPFDRLNPTIGAAYPADTHESMKASHLAAYDPKMRHATDLNDDPGSAELREWKLAKELRQEFGGTFYREGRKRRDRPTAPDPIKSEGKA
jgi:hypothetical protein